MNPAPPSMRQGALLHATNRLDHCRLIGRPGFTHNAPVDPSSGRVGPWGGGRLLGRAKGTWRSGLRSRKVPVERAPLDILCDQAPESRSHAGSGCSPASPFPAHKPVAIAVRGSRSQGFNGSERTPAGRCRSIQSGDEWLRRRPAVLASPSRAKPPNGRSRYAPPPFAALQRASAPGGGSCALHFRVVWSHLGSFQLPGASALAGESRHARPLAW